MKFSLLLFFIGLCLAADPDQFRNARELISSKGYPVEEHYVTTVDGYILYVLRIPHGVNGKSGKKPVILQHGVLDSADTWLLNLANESLAFILADAGYDVWLGNSRGNKYSRGHTTLDPNSSAYWKFSWDEMAHYDVTGVIQYVTGKTGYSKVAFIGHSQGTTQMFANLATSQTVASKLDIFIALAPVAYVYNTKSILLKAISEIDLDKIISFFDDKAFLPSTAFLKWLLPDLCKATPALCDSVLYLIAGDNFKYINQSRWDVIVSHFPSGTSTKDMCHWAQGVREDKFRMYDYGLIGNEEKYHQATPPKYNLSAINNVPLALFYGGQDDLADTTDVKRLIAELPSLNIVKVQYYPSAGHCEFVWAPDAATTIYPLVIDLLG